ncbi:MAG: hypothetical protein K2X44_09490 [Magnetospirillum sp.]|nr:hypothetical protein [Magnetospirillum sp.]
MTHATDDDLAALSKSELLRVIRLMRPSLYLQLTKADVIAVQAEEADEKATEALNASIAMTVEANAAHQAAMAAIRESGAVATTGGRKAREAERKMKEAGAACDAITAKKNKLFDSYKHHNRRAKKLWKQLERERTQSPTTTYHEEF